MASNPRIDDLRKRLEKEPNSRLFAQLAEELRKDGEFEEAIRIARAGLARHASYPSARMTLGRALFDTGDMASARQELQSVLEGAPDNILASRLLAECLEGLGDLEGALKRYRATLALSPGDKQITAHVTSLEGKLQAAARPGTGTPPAPGAAPMAPIKVATVDEPMVLETSHERHAPAEPAAAPVAESPAEFELESAYDAPGTQWQRPVEPAAVPPEGPTPPDPAAPVASPEPGPAAADVFRRFDGSDGERTLIDEPAPTIVAAAAAEPAFQQAFNASTDAARPATPEPAPMPPLPEPVTAPPVVAPAPPFVPEVSVQPPLPPVVTPLPEVVPAEAATPEPWVEPAAAPAPTPAVAPPPPPVVAAPAAPASSAAEAELVSPTLAELYFNQGFPEKAIEVYRRLLEREPGNERARVRVAELQTIAAAPPAAPAPAATRDAGSAAREADEARAARRQALERTIERLETLRAALQKGAR